MGKNNFTKDLLYCSFIFLVSVLISIPLFKGQFLCCCDYAGTLMRLLSMKQSLDHGQWLVRWVPGLYMGCGYPVFNFYPPLFYFLGIGLVKLGANIVAAVNLSLFIVLFLSGWAMYLFSRELWGREGGLVCAVAYLFAPYHMVDLYLRSAAAETAAFVFLPLILWSFYKLHQDLRKRYLAYAAFSSAGLLLTHNCTSIIFFPLLPVYILLIYWPYRRVLALWRPFAALVLGMGMAAFFWLPAFIEKKFVHTELLSQGNLNFKENFIYFKDLIAPLWSGKDMPYFGGPHLFCRLGPAHILAVLIVLLGFNKIIRQAPPLKRQILFFTVLLTAGIFFTLPYSLLMWEHVQTLQYLQFPFRFLTLVVFATSVIAGGIVLLVRQEYRLKLALLVAAAIFGANFYYCHPRDIFRCDLHLVKSDPDKFLSELCQQDGGEYLPIWVKNNGKRLPAFMRVQQLGALEKGDQVLEVKQISSLHYKFVVLARHLDLFCFKSFYFPGWVVIIDGHQVPILKDNPFGLITFECPEGMHNVDIYFGTTPVRQTAQEISIACLIVLIVTLLF